MNKALLSLNSILVIVVGYLLYDSVNNEPTNDINISTEVVKKPSSNSGNYKIAYVNSDTLWANYELVQEMKDKITAEKTKTEREYGYQVKNLETEVLEFQQKAQYMSIQQGTEREAELMQKQQELLQLQETLNIKLLESEQKKNQRIYDSISNYINQYSIENNIHFVLGFNMSGSMFYGADTLNITNDILDALNNRYKSSKKPS